MQEEVKARPPSQLQKSAADDLFAQIVSESAPKQNGVGGDGGRCQGIENVNVDQQEQSDNQTLDDYIQ